VRKKGHHQQGAVNMRRVTEMNLEFLKRKSTWALLAFGGLLLSMTMDKVRDAVGMWLIVGLALGVVWVGRRSPRRRCKHCLVRLPASFRVCTSCGRNPRRTPMVTWQRRVLHLSDVSTARVFSGPGQGEQAVAGYYPVESADTPLAS
jgi:hypothetical protein